MNLLVTILLAVLIFGVIIIIHELGHFLTAKAAGVAVPEFSIGMGPKLFQIKHKETNYTLRLLPIGGYVAMEGEDEESDDERAFCNKKPLQKILVIAAGATMNRLLGFLIMVGITASEPAVSSTQIGYFAPDALSACIAASIPAMYGNILISIGSASAAPSVNAEYMSTRFISAYIISPSIIRGRI